MLLCLNNMKLLPILIWSYELKLSNLRLVQQVHAQSMMSKKLKEMLASSQDAYKTLLAKMETMCKYCDELTNKVATSSR